MRIGSIVTAIVVSLVVYLFIMQRDTLMSLAENGAAQEADATQTVAPTDTRSAVLVQAIHSKERTVDSAMIFRGRTAAFRLLDVKAETSGRIISQPLRKGALVEEGQLLCELDPGTKLANLAEARARLAEAEANNQVAAELVKKGFASETNAIGREAALKSAQAAVIRAENDIADLKIFAAFSGLLESDTAELGELLQPGSICARIISLDPIRLVAFATEGQVAKIKVGTAAGARLFDGTQIRGQVSFLSRIADPDTRTYRVEITVPNPDLAIRDGATAEIFIALTGERGHLLPQSALTLDDNGRLGVRTVDDNIAGFAPVSILRDAPEGVWVTGLPEELDIIVVGQEFVTDGRRVTARFEEDAS